MEIRGADKVETAELDRLNLYFPGWTEYERHNAPSGLKLVNSLIASGSPKKFREAQLTDFSEELQSYSRKSLFIYGGKGTGKTRYAVAHQKDWMLKNWLDPSRPRLDTAFVNVSELIFSLRRSFNDKEAPNEYGLIDNASTSPFLYLDDLGTEVVTDYVFNVLYVIINRRYNNELPIVVTSNFDLQILQDKVGEAITGRILEMVDLQVDMGADSWRIPK